MSDRQVACIGWATIFRLMKGETVSIGDVDLIAADGLHGMDRDALELALDTVILGRVASTEPNPRIERTGGPTLMCDGDKWHEVKP